MSFYDTIIVEAVFQVLIITGFLLILLFYNKLNFPFRWLFFLFMTDIIVATQLNMNYTVTGHEYKPHRMAKDLALCPKKFPIPIDDKIIYNDQLHALFPPFWRNTYTFSKQVSFSAFSSFELNSYSKLDDEYPNLRNAVLNHHLVYFSDVILPLSQFNDSTFDPVTNRDDLYIPDDNYKILANKNVKVEPTDFIKFLEFSPNKISVETGTANDQFLTMLQTNFKGWKAFIANLYFKFQLQNNFSSQGETYGQV